MHRSFLDSFMHDGNELSVLPKVFGRDFRHTEALNCNVIWQRLVWDEAQLVISPVGPDAKKFDKDAKHRARALKCRSKQITVPLPKPGVF